MAMQRPLTLASSSPRRVELLTKMGYTFSILKPEVDENVEGHARDIVLTLAERKALACEKDVKKGVVIASDTLVSLNGRPLGKPEDREDAYRMLSSLSGKAHEVYTGVCVLDVESGKRIVREDCTRVFFRDLTDDRIWRYIDSGEPMDRAGAYAIQGGAAPFVEKIEGAFDTVVGFPTALAEQMLKDIGIGG